MNVRLIDLHTAEEWQCAYASIEHAVKGRCVCLEFEGPDGDAITLSIEDRGHEVTVRKQS